VESMFRGSRAPWGRSEDRCDRAGINLQTQPSGNPLIKCKAGRVALLTPGISQMNREPKSIALRAGSERGLRC
jgi:hypothetical protein